MENFDSECFTRKESSFLVAMIRRRNRLLLHGCSLNTDNKPRSGQTLFHRMTFRFCILLSKKVKVRRYHILDICPYSLTRCYRRYPLLPFRRVFSKSLKNFCIKSQVAHFTDTVTRTPFSFLVCSVTSKLSNFFWSFWFSSAIKLTSFSVYPR
jgi:hypothetical protein